jgi:hypothetical protein
MAALWTCSLALFKLTQLEIHMEKQIHSTIMKDELLNDAAGIKVKPLTHFAAGRAR